MTREEATSQLLAAITGGMTAKQAAGKVSTAAGEDALAEFGRAWVLGRAQGVEAAIANLEEL
jgi:hypothetical protein